jgi:hypothetical protein
MKGSAVSCQPLQPAPVTGNLGCRGIAERLPKPSLRTALTPAKQEFPWGVQLIGSGSEAAARGTRRPKRRRNPRRCRPNSWLLLGLENLHSVVHGSPAQRQGDRAAAHSSRGDRGRTRPTTASCFWWTCKIRCLPVGRKVNIIVFLGGIRPLWGYGNLVIYESQSK